LKVQNLPPFVLKRSEAFIGVMIDDLVTKEADEPYRLLTSRAEYRLLLRQDNADLRLTEKGRQIGLVDDRRWNLFKTKLSMLEETTRCLQQTTFTPADTEVANFLSSKTSAPLRDRISLWEMLRRPELGIQDFVERGWLAKSGHEILEQLEIQAKYAGYINKQLEQVQRFERMENKRIPPDIAYHEVYSLSNEARQKLEEIRPGSLGHASRISGVTPADINILLIFLEKRRN
jgi:tRNA uridine 5-carboxymethylaminomethyl modification enzyme